MQSVHSPAGQYLLQVQAGMSAQQVQAYFAVLHRDYTLLNSMTMFGSPCESNGHLEGMYIRIASEHLQS